ncbi:MAG: hypothetical protein HQM16_07190 [Deltaproteobacteria bacterium]|nr:hypothetical protein [Deltaproteobacteria bacterium]
MTTIKSTIDKNAERYRLNYEANIKLIDELNNKITRAQNCGSEKAIAKFKKQGKLLTRERIEALLDTGSPFLEFSPLAAIGLYNDEFIGASCVTGIGCVCGVECMIMSSEPLVKGGASNPMTVQKYLRAQEFAMQNRLPGIHLVESAGANLMYAGDVFVPGGGLFRNITKSSALKIPQVALVFGSSTAGGAYIPALSDHVVMVKDAAMIYLGGPPLVKMATNEISTDEELGGAQMHNTVSGVADYLAENDADAILLGRRIVGNLGWRKTNSIVPEHEPRQPLYDRNEILGIVSPDPRYPFDVKEVIARLVDGSDMEEFKPLYGTTLVTGFAHINGYLVGIIANNGILFSDSSQKAAHFIQLCNQRKIPIIYLCNITGFMVGKKYEEGGIVKHGANMINAVTNATVPQITIVIGAAHGAGYYAMCGRPYNPRFIASWPCSKTSVMGPEQGAGVMATVRRAALEKEGKVWTTEEEEQYKAPIKYMFEEQCSPYHATGKLYDDGIIDPRKTREVITIILSAAANAEIPDANYGVFRM